MSSSRTQGVARRLYRCTDCRYQFSVTVGTPFHDSHLPLSKWFVAVHWVISSERTVSGRGLSRRLSICYESAWKMLRKVRAAIVVDRHFCEQVAHAYEALSKVTVATAPRASIVRQTEIPAMWE